MIGCQNDLIAKFRKLKSDIVAVHFIIHQENLSAIVMDMEHVSSVVLKTVNYICSRELNHRKFQEFWGHLERQYGYAVYFTDARWFSRTSTLHRFWLLKDEVNMFMNLKGKEVPQLFDSNWLMDFAFLNYISQALAKFNVKLQGENKLVNELFKHLQTFERDLELYEQSLDKQKVDHFPTLKSVFDGSNEILDSYARRVAVLREEFSSRFTDFRSLRSHMAVFAHPCTCKISSTPVKFQLELSALQEDDVLVQNFRKMNFVDFCKSLPVAECYSLKQFAKKFVCMFGSTYTCEQLFSKVKLVKSSPTTACSLTNYYLNICMCV